MKDLSLHLLDIAQNSVKAGATLVVISLQREREMLCLSVEDNGCGMPPDFLRRVTDPFTTTRTTRRVGLGLPLLKMAAEQTGGSFAIESVEGQGTVLRACFVQGHIDTPPAGRMSDTMVTLIQGAPDIDFIYRDNDFTLDTRELREVLEDVPLNTPEALLWIAEHISEHTKHD